MIDAAAMNVAVRPSRITAHTLDAERLALGTTAAALAMLPLLVPRGPANLGPVDVFMGASIATCLVWAAAGRRRWRFVYALPMALFLAAGALGALVGPVPSAGIVAIIQEFFLLVWCWSLANVCRSRDRLRLVGVTWAYAAIVWASLLFIGIATGSTFLTGHSAREGSRTALTFVDPNISANYYFISMMVIWAFGRPRHRGLRLLAYALLLAALITTGSNSGIVSVCVGVTVAAVIGIYRRSGALAAVTALAFVSLAGYLLVSNVSIGDVQERAHGSRYAFIRDGIGRGEVSVSQRGALLHESVALYKSGGLLGQGPVSTKPRLEREQAPFVKEAHDDYFSALIERGALGLAAFALLVGGVAFRGWSVASPRRAAGVAAVVAKPNALVGALAGTFVAASVYELLHVRHVWALFALVGALYMWSKE